MNRTNANFPERVWGVHAPPVDGMKEDFMKRRLVRRGSRTHGGFGTSAFQRPFPLDGTNAIFQRGFEGS